MSRHRYPAAILYPDYARVAVGLMLTAGPLVLLDLTTAIGLLFSGLTLLFGWFGVRTGLRQLCWVELSSEAIAIRGPLSQHLSWDQLARMKLAYYAPRKAGSDGWLQLTLRGAHDRPLRVESTLDGFDEVLRRAVGVATRKRLALDPTTAANLAALGFDRDRASEGEVRRAPPHRDLSASPGPKSCP